MGHTNVKTCFSEKNGARFILFQNKSEEQEIVSDENAFFYCFYGKNIFLDVIFKTTFNRNVFGNKDNFENNSDFFFYDRLFLVFFFSSF